MIRTGRKMWTDLKHYITEFKKPSFKSERDVLTTAPMKLELCIGSSIDGDAQTKQRRIDIAAASACYACTKLTRTVH